MWARIKIWEVGKKNVKCAVRRELIPGCSWGKRCRSADNAPVTKQQMALDLQADGDEESE